MKVIIRPFNLSADAGLIYSSYPKGVYHGSYEPITTPKSEWFGNFYLLTKQQLEGAAKVTIACIEDDPSTILGYMITQGGTLQFIYTKEAFRNQGVARLLYNSNPLKLFKNITKVGHAILADRLIKENPNEQEPS